MNGRDRIQMSVVPFFVRHGNKCRCTPIEFAELNCSPKRIITISAPICRQFDGVNGSCTLRGPLKMHGSGHSPTIDISPNPIELVLILHFLLISTTILVKRPTSPTNILRLSSSYLPLLKQHATTLTITIGLEKTCGSSILCHKDPSYHRYQDLEYATYSKLIRIELRHHPFTKPLTWLAFCGTDC
jgi:hypothetical protein